MCDFGLAVTLLVQVLQGAALPVPDSLDRILARAISRLNEIDTVSVQVSWTTDDRAFQTVEAFIGTAVYQKPGRLKLDLTRKGKPEARETLVFGNEALYWFDYAAAEIRIFQLQAGVRATEDLCVTLFNFWHDCSSWFFVFFGAKAEPRWTAVTAETIRQRFTVAQDKPNEPHYIYLNFTPRSSADRKDFSRAQLVLSKDTYLPRRVWIEFPNRNALMWDLTDIKANGGVPEATWKKPDLPVGWKWLEMPAHPDKTESKK